MTKRELIQTLLRNAEDIDAEATVVVLYRDEGNVVRLKAEVPVLYLGFEGAIWIEGRLIDECKVLA